MNPYTERLLGYICLSLFLAFAAGPYTAQKIVSKTEPVVYLSAVGLGSSAQKPACLETVINISEKDLAPFPKIKEAVSTLSRSPIETNQVSLYGGNLEAFIKRSLGQSQKEICFEYGGRTFKLTWLIIRDMGTLYLVGLNEPPSVPSLVKSSLSKYPEMAAYIKNLERTAQSARDIKPKEETMPAGSPSGESMKTIDDAMKRFEQIRRQAERQLRASPAANRDAFYRSERTQLNRDEWASLNMALGTDPERAVFRTGDYLIMGVSETFPENVLINIEWFRIGRYSAETRRARFGCGSAAPTATIIMKPEFSKRYSSRTAIVRPIRAIRFGTACCGKRPASRRICCCFSIAALTRLSTKIAGSRV